MTEELEENPNCGETHATFRVIGESLDLAGLTSQLGISPSFTRSKGEKIETSSRPLESRTNIWALETERKLKSTSLERHLIFLLDQLEYARETIIELAADPSIRVEFHCYWLSETGHGGPVLSCEVLRRITNLGADLDFDFYCAD